MTSRVQVQPRIGFMRNFATFQCSGQMNRGSTPVIASPAHDHHRPRRPPMFR
jgi:hypothetical protein